MPLRIVIAPDKFKGSLSATAAADAMATGVCDAVPDADVDRCPMADGGDGTADVLLASVGGRRVVRRVTGPLPEHAVDAGYVVLDNGTAVIEVAAASGLAMLAADDRDPMQTTTFGTGELVAAAVCDGARHVLLALGGSATVDGGLGCVQACGFTVLTVDGEPTSLTEPLCGRDLERVLMVKRGRGEVTAGVTVTGLCDVTNPLCGPTGAARVFGPQKGASAADVEWLDGQLRRLAQGHPDAAGLPGAGAAGGLGFAVAAYFGGTLRSGFDVVAGAVRLADRLDGADLVLTGEGNLDATTAGGKTVAGVGRLSAAAGVPCLAIVGSSTVTALPPGVTGVTTLVGPGVTTERAQRDVATLLRRRTAEAAWAWAVGTR